MASLRVFLRIYSVFCLTENKKLHLIVNERDCVLRNKENYETLLSANRVSISGRKESSVFNQIENFHITENLTVDPQHDLLQGVLRYDVPKILDNLIYKCSFFTLEDINLRLAGFNLGTNDNVNKPLALSKNQIINHYMIILSAEMLNLFRSLFLIVGPFVPEETLQWQLFIKLRRIVEICFSKVVNSLTYKLLDTEITEYLSAFSDTYPKQMKVDPLPNCMRYESKHRGGKVSSHVAICRKNELLPLDIN